MIANNRISDTSGAGIFAFGIFDTAFATASLELIANTIEPGDKAGDGIVVGTAQRDRKIGGTRICDNRIGKAKNGIRVRKNPFQELDGPIVLNGNRLQKLDGNGITIERATLVSALIEHNVLNTILGNGIFVMFSDSPDSHVMVLGNELTDIGSGSAPEVAGIYLNGVSEGAVSDNSILNVGTNSAKASTIAGVRVANSGDGDMRISDNTITVIAAASDSSTAAGILVTGIARIEINDNLIRRLGKLDPTQGPWQAIRIVSTRGDGPAGEQAGIHGNSLHGYGRTPMVEVFVSGACRFSDNHCSLLGKNDSSAVDITAASVVASANRIECGGKTPAALVLKGVVRKKFTVVGNIVGAPIQVPGGLGPWQPLNVIAL
jgi:hypothetical protein